MKPVHLLRPSGSLDRTSTRLRCLVNWLPPRDPFSFSSNTLSSSSQPSWRAASWTRSAWSIATSVRLLRALVANVGLVDLSNLALTAYRRQDAARHRLAETLEHQPCGLQGDAEHASTNKHHPSWMGSATILSPYSTGLRRCTSANTTPDDYYCAPLLVERSFTTAQPVLN